MTAPRKSDARLYVSRIVYDGVKPIPPEEAAGIAASFVEKRKRRRSVKPGATDHADATKGILSVK